MTAFGIDPLVGGRALAERDRPLVVTLLGTDHHPFDRLVDWMDELARSLGDGARVVVQHGHSTAPRVAEGQDFVEHDDLVGLVAAADVVVCHGGPGTIMDARRAGHVPVCVPRDPERGEHVDGHQQRFAAHVDDIGMVRLADGYDALDAAVADAIETGPSVEVGTADVVAEASAARFAREVDLVVGRRVRRLPSVRRSLLSRVQR
ncbi:glycosyltransferase [Nocardioides alkalitolerans]|uniref:glycosyltransferase n=1 Tax=Nocardioides alkalitolerans TaxID=281714 RepID=UPI0003FFB581|nr:glycosyltransferase [Nocardioides alkalitolerans]